VHQGKHVGGIKILGTKNGTKGRLDGTQKKVDKGNT
jgi:hypothetical protein